MSGTPPDPFELALADLFAPLTRAMIARGVTLAAANEALKQALLHAAIESDGADISDSRVSIMTGLHRKDVRRLRNASIADPSRKSINRAALLIGYWMTAPDYVDGNGNPRLLSRAGDDTGPGFNDLVRLARIDVAPGTLLTTLRDQGSVIDTADGRLQLRREALIPAANSEELVAAYRATLSAHMTAATQNLLAGDEAPRNFDRVVRYSHLSDTSISELEAMARDGAQKLLRDLNARARALQDADANAVTEGATGRFAAGVFILPTRQGNKAGDE